MTMRKFDIELVLDSDGNVDAEETHQGALAAIQQYAELTKCDVGQIRGAMLGVFEKNPSLTLNVPALVSLTMARVWSGEPSVYGPLSKRVMDVLHGSSEIIVEKGPSKGARLRNEAERSFYDANGRDESKEERIVREATAKLEAAKTAARK